MPYHRVILPLLALFGVLLSLGVVGAMPACAATPQAALASADEGHACCHHGKDQASPKNSDHHPKADCTGKCLMECCRAMMPAEVKLDRIAVAPALTQSVALPAALVTLTTPDSIFHPPKA
jgi:hypothetical protein